MNRPRQGPLPSCPVPCRHDHGHHHYALGSASWWTGSRAVLDGLMPAYHSLAQAVCQAKSFTRKYALLRDPGFPPLDLLHDCATQHHGIQILLSDPPHPLVHVLFEVLRLATSTAPVPKNTGLFRIVTLLHQVQVFSSLGPSHET